MQAAEFASYGVQDAAKLTFCLKELRAASLFCDFVNKVSTQRNPTCSGGCVLPPHKIIASSSVSHVSPSTILPGRATT